MALKFELFFQDGAATGSEDRILVIGATNRPQEIDEAARRRFVKRLLIPLPEAVARRQIVCHLMAKQNSDLSEAEIQAITEQSDGEKSSSYLYRFCHCSGIWWTRAH